MVVVQVDVRAGEVTTVAGVEAYSGPPVDGTGSSIRFSSISGISIDSSTGILYIATGDGAHSFDTNTGERNFVSLCYCLNMVLCRTIVPALHFNFWGSIGVVL